MFDWYNVGRSRAMPASVLIRLRAQYFLFACSHAGECDRRFFFMSTTTQDSGESLTAYRSRVQTPYGWWGRTKSAARTVGASMPGPWARS